MASFQWNISEAVKEVVEICHVRELFPRENYRTVLVSKREGFNPLHHQLVEDWRLAFKEVLKFWYEKYTETDTILEYTILNNSSDRNKALCALVEIFNGSEVLKVVRRAHDFEAVLDMHVSLAEEFEKLHPAVVVWDTTEQ